ncbi:hypothetical protein C8R44DRAFT_861360 [Mycena epipterygia]|nr:hypothetical protein C8R44DRAFT_861360 [Mycena epipterygia]
MNEYSPCIHSLSVQRTNSTSRSLQLFRTPSKGWVGMELSSPVEGQMGQLSKSRAWFFDDACPVRLYVMEMLLQERVRLWIEHFETCSPQTVAFEYALLIGYTNDPGEERTRRAERPVLTLKWISGGGQFEDLPKICLSSKSLGRVDSGLKIGLGSIAVQDIGPHSTAPEWSKRDLYDFRHHGGEYTLHLGCDSRTLPSLHHTRRDLLLDLHDTRLILAHANASAGRRTQDAGRRTQARVHSTRNDVGADRVEARSPRPERVTAAPTAFWMQDGDNHESLRHRKIAGVRSRDHSSIANIAAGSQASQHPVGRGDNAFRASGRARGRSHAPGSQDGYSSSPAATRRKTRPLVGVEGHRWSWSCASAARHYGRRHPLQVRRLAQIVRLIVFITKAELGVIHLELLLVVLVLPSIGHSGSSHRREGEQGIKRESECVVVVAPPISQARDSAHEHLSRMQCRALVVRWSVNAR